MELLCEGTTISLYSNFHRVKKNAQYFRVLGSYLCRKRSENLSTHVFDNFRAQSKHLLLGELIDEGRAVNAKICHVTGTG